MERSRTKNFAAKHLNYGKVASRYYDEIKCPIGDSIRIKFALALVALITLSISALSEGQKNDTKVMINDHLDQNSSVRLAIADALGNINDTRAVEPLIQALRDEDDGVRKSAADALGNINDTRAVEPLIQVLKDENGHAKEPR